MLSLWHLPLEKVYKFLSYTDRLALACTCSKVFACVKQSLKKKFDIEISYEAERRRVLAPKKAKKWALPVVELKSGAYSFVEMPIFALSEAVRSMQYAYECNEHGLGVFTNRFHDKLMIHPSLIEVGEQNEFNLEFLADSSDLNEEMDFTNPAMLLKRQKMLLEKVHKAKSEAEETRKKEALKHIRNWGEVVIILCHGGNFNISGFGRTGNLIESHSDHKYVTRKKQGGRQSTADKQSGGIHSKGASIRRENEKKHVENIEGILQEAKTLLDRSMLIFLHAPGTNYYLFIKQNGYLEKWKDKVRPIGMTTNKAKFQEAERVFKEISTVKVLFRM